MPTPQEIAGYVKQFDTDEWFDFLDLMDQIARDRPQGGSAPPQPDRDSVARWVARKHLQSDSGIREVWYLPDGAAANEIRLLEVNDLLGAGSGPIAPIDFGLDLQAARFKLLVADATSDQLARVQSGDFSLPATWSLSGAVVERRKA